MNDLQIVINEIPAIINDNFAEVKESLANMMQAYEGLTYTDDTVKDARNDIATLRKIRKAIDDKRKEVKKSHMIPYDEFEGKCKELCSIIDNAINPIDEQIKEYDERKRQERKAAIREYFDSKIGDINCLTFEDVFIPSWISNMSTTMKLIKSVIDCRIEEVKADLETIEQSNSEVKDKALATYKQTKRLSDAMKVINDYEQQKREILAREEARRKEEEERRRQEEERRRIEEEQRKAREEAARIAEEERRKREEEARIEREKQEAIEKAKAEERARIQREIAEKQKLQQIPQKQPVNPFKHQNTSTEPVQQNPFGQAPTMDPFASAQEPVEQISGEVIATSQPEQSREIMLLFKATDSQIDEIEKYLLSINVSFVKQVM